MILGPQSIPGAPEWLKVHLLEFSEHLRRQGYAPRTMNRYSQVVRQFCTEVGKLKLGIDDLNGRGIETLQKAMLSHTPENLHTSTKFCLRRLLDHLASAGVAHLPSPPARTPTDLDHLCVEFDAYLRDQRGLSEATVYKCMRCLKLFIAFRFEGSLGNLNDITSGDIIAFLCERRSPLDPSPASLRNFFRFLFWSGKTRQDLARTIPPVVQPQPVELPRHLKPDKIKRLIEAVRRNDAAGRRNYAMLVLTARLGLRPQEVITIQLQDIHWRRGQILIRGKGRLLDPMPLPADVGEAIIDYIMNGRRGASRTLFVSLRAPHRPFRNSKVLRCALRKAFERTGLKPQKNVGAYLLRHSLATDLLRRGASLDEIGNVLRHRSRATTMIYAKHDLSALRSIARAWPVQGGTQ